MHKVDIFGIIANFANIPTYLQFAALFGDYDASQFKILYQWVLENRILKLYSPLVQLFSNGTAKTKLAMLAFFVEAYFEKTLIG